MKKAKAFFIVLLFLVSTIFVTTPAAKADTSLNSLSAQTTGSSSSTGDSMNNLNDQSGLLQPYVIDQENSNPSGQDSDLLFSGESSQLQNASFPPVFPLQAASPGGFEPLLTPPPVVYDMQVGLTFSQNYSSLSYNVTAVQQVDENGYGPAYLLNGLTDSGYWYQVGLAFNWPYVTGGYASGMGLAYMVFDNAGSPIYGGLSSFTGSINDGDVVLLSLTFLSGNVVMFAKDWNTSSTAQQTYSAMGGSYFRGLIGAIGDDNGFFTEIGRASCRERVSRSV
jgi:hypothetical protein